MCEPYVIKKFMDLQHGDVFLFGELNDDFLKVCCRYGSKITYYAIGEEYWAANTSTILDDAVVHLTNRKIRFRTIEISVLRITHSLFQNFSLDWLISQLRRVI